MSETKKAPRPSRQAAKPQAKAEKPAKPTAKPAKAGPIDWDVIEASHRTGRYSDGQLATMHGVSREAIVRRRKREQAQDPTRWQKDLREQVRQTTAALLAADAVKRESEGDHTTVTAKITDVIAASAMQGKDVILRHRTDIANMQSLAADLMEELRATTLKQGELARVFEVLATDMDEKELAQARQTFRDFIRVHSRVGSAQKLADTLTKLQAAERKAFNLDDPAEQPKPPAPSLADLQPGEEVDAYRAWVNG